MLIQDSDIVNLTDIGFAQVMIRHVDGLPPAEWRHSNCLETASQTYDRLRNQLVLEAKLASVLQPYRTHKREWRNRHYQSWPDIWLQNKANL